MEGKDKACDRDNDRDTFLIPQLSSLVYMTQEWVFGNYGQGKKTIIRAYHLPRHNLLKIKLSGWIGGSRLFS